MRESPLNTNETALGRSNNRFRTRGLCAAAAGLGASAVATPASATIIHTTGLSDGPGSTILLDGLSTISGISLETSGMMNSDLSLDSPAGMGMMNPDSTVQFLVDSGGAPDLLRSLSASDTVDGSVGNIFADEGFIIDSGVTNWTPGTTGYAGFFFNDGATDIYGWVEMDFSADSSTFTVLQYAYDDSGAAIQVGAIPEPSTALLLGLGLVGLAAVCRRRGREVIAGGNA